LINNGKNDASWEIRIINKQFPRIFRNTTLVDLIPFIRASIVTTNNSSKTWDVAMVHYNHWHHIVMTYDGETVKFYLNNRLVKNDMECCRGNIMTRHNDVVIGDGGRRSSGHIIDEVFLLKKALTADQVRKLYQTLTFDETTAISSSSSLHSVSFLILIVFLACTFLNIPN
jgi:hypothetical protein